MDPRGTAQDVHRLTFDIDWPPGNVACYVIDGPEPVLVDATTPDHGTAFGEQLGAHELAPADVDHVLITHPHVDHIGQVPTVLTAGEPTVYAPAGVRERFARDPSELAARVRRNATAAGFPEEQREMAVEMAVESLERNSDLLGPDAVDVWIEPGDTTAVGPIEVGAVHVPGHQADHLAFPVELGGESALFAGDMAVEPFRSVSLHDGMDDGHCEAIDAFYAALDRLAALDVDRVYPGHGPVHRDLQGVVRRDRESLDARLDGVRRLVADGNETAAEVAFALAGDREVEYIVPEATAALAHLESTGAVSVELVDGVRRYDA